MSCVLCVVCCVLCVVCCVLCVVCCVVRVEHSLFVVLCGVLCLYESGACGGDMLNFNPFGESGFFVVSRLPLPSRCNDALFCFLFDLCGGECGGGVKEAEEQRGVEAMVLLASAKVSTLFLPLLPLPLLQPLPLPLPSRGLILPPSGLILSPPRDSVGFSAPLRSSPMPFERHSI